MPLELSTANTIPASADSICIHRRIMKPDFSISCRGNYSHLSGAISLRDGVRNVVLFTILSVRKNLRNVAAAFVFRLTAK